MNILLSSVSNPHFEARPDYLASALRPLEHGVVRFDHRHMFLPGRPRRRIPILERLDRARLNRLFLRTVRSTRPGLVLVHQGATLRGETIEASRRLGARCANWFSDSPSEFDERLAVTPSYDPFVHGASHAVRWGALQIVDRPGDLLPLRRAGAARGPEEVLARHTYEHRARCLTDPRFGGIKIPEKPGALLGIAGGASA